LVAQRQQQPAPWLMALQGLLRPAKLVSLGIAAAMLILVFLSAKALPGETLYPIKHTAITLENHLPRSETAQLSHLLELSEKQITEIENLVAAERVVPTAALQRYRSTWQELRSYPETDNANILTAADTQAQRWQRIQSALLPGQQQLAQEISDLLEGDKKQPTPQTERPTPSPTLTPPVVTPTASPRSPTPNANANQHERHVNHTATPTPAPTLQLTPTSTAIQPSHTPAYTATPPADHRTATPATTATPTATRAHHHTATPAPTKTPIPSPTATATVHPHPTQHPTTTPSPTSTPQPTQTSGHKKKHTPTVTPTPKHQHFVGY